MQEFARLPSCEGFEAKSEVEREFESVRRVGPFSLVQSV